MSINAYFKDYKRRLIAPQDASAMVTSGMSIHLGGGANVAAIIDKYLAQRKDELKDVTVRTFLDTHSYEILRVDPRGDVFKWYSGFVMPHTRSFAGDRGCGMYAPASWHLVPDIVRRQYAFDILFLVTSPMNLNGNFSFGLTVGHMKALTDVSRKVVVVVREDMPATFGGREAKIHISKVDQIVEDCEFETYCLPAPEVSAADRIVAENILSAGLIKDGTTLQVGIGGLPNSVLDALPRAGIKHCGLHSEMLTEKMVDLIECGVVDNSRKKLDPNKSVCTFALGSKRLYRFIADNPAVVFHPVNYVNNPLIVARQPQMFSLNSALEIDLTGQVASEQIGGLRPRQISGTGGQLDFVTGAMLAEDGAGVSVLAISSQYHDQSRIVPLLSEGTAVTVPRSAVDYVATEWGIAHLKGLTIDERAQSLIQIAHPHHRDKLAQQAAKTGLLPYGASVIMEKRNKGIIYYRD
nr:acetyl-CoA hydrolase/transferase C-terminal domain-containing protein [Desulfosarcina widdelii]